MRPLLLLLALSLSTALQAGAFDHRHAAWTALLGRHVSWLDAGHASVVDYPGFAAQRQELDAYLGMLSAVSPDEYRRWQRDQRLAFLINAYNAFTVKLVLDHYPVDSIKDIGGWFRSPWQQAFIPLLGQEVSLDEIEHEMIRAPGAFDEPRIHFAVNCASVGCPALRDEAFVAERLDQQLADSQARFLSDRSRNRYDAQRQRLQVSKIFDWYGADFASKWGSLEAYLLRQRASLGLASNPADLRIDYLDYDWRLNERAH